MSEGLLRRLTRLRLRLGQRHVESVPVARTPGEPGSGGYYAAATNEPVAARHTEFQYAGMAHQADTALAGMWLFLATELLFFGGLFFIYAAYRLHHPLGTARASHEAELAIGTVNTVLLLTSSAVFAWGLGRARVGRNVALFWASLITGGLGILFLSLKAYEWLLDFGNHMFPGPNFGMSGPDMGGAELFWCFYFVATGLHGLHMIVGVGLVGWIAWAARRERFGPSYFTPVEVVGLYWSFVDMVWLVLYPTIYLAGRLGP
jgi:cytochrome c oxidase subunit 3